MADIVKAAGVVIKDGKMLMVKKYSQSFLGMLGGTLEEGETLTICLKREIPEEIGVNNFKILDSEPFYVAYSVVASDPTKSLEIHCSNVEIYEEPKPTYDPSNPEKIAAGYNISEIHWVGKEDLDSFEENGLTKYKLKPTFKDIYGKILTLTPITEDFIFPEFIKRGIVY